MIYLGCLGILIVVYMYTASVNGGKINLNTSIISKRELGVISLFLILAIGLRHISVGWDTVEYYRLFTKVESITTIKELIAYKLTGVTSVEWGFLVYEWFFAKTIGFQWFLITSAAVYVLPIMIYIKKYSKDPFFSVFLFITYGLFVFAFSTIRQSMAMGLCMCAIMFCHEKKYFRFALFLFLAILFHRTALIFLPAIFYDKFKIKRITVIAICIGAVACYLGRSSILVFLEGFARNNSAHVDTGGTFQYLFVLLLIGLGIIFRNKLLIRNENATLNRFWFVSLCVTAVIFPILQVTPTYFRLYYYNYIFMIAYVPALIGVLPDRLMKIGFKILLLALGFFLFYKTIVLTTNPLLPYTFFWS